MIYIGPEQRPSGRAGVLLSKDLAESLKACGFSWGRSKTGTPPRLDRASIDFDRQVRAGAFTIEKGDDPAVPFSFMTDRIEREQIDCYLLHTTDYVHYFVRANLAKSPLFNGQIQGIGPDTVLRSKTKSCASLPAIATTSLTISPSTGAVASSWGMFAVLAPTLPAMSSRPLTDCSMLPTERMSIRSRNATINAATRPMTSARVQSRCGSFADRHLP